MDRLIPPGPWVPAPKVSRGPWFKKYFIEDDGLEYFYVYKNAEGDKKFLLSNNLPLEDREALQSLYKGYRRNMTLSFLGGLWGSLEIVSRVKYFKKMAYGWRFLSFLGVAQLLTYGIRYYGSGYYAMPMLAAFFKKYDHFAKTDRFDIRDEKREWFEIDTSQYMSYTFSDLDHHHHNVNHGPQPDGEALDSSWFNEMEKFLKGEKNSLKEHPRYKDYNFDYSDKYNWPSTDLVHSVFHAKEVEQHTPESLKPGVVHRKKDM